MGVSAKEPYLPLPPSPPDFCASGGITWPWHICGAVCGLEMGTIAGLVQIQDMYFWISLGEFQKKFQKNSKNVMEPWIRACVGPGPRVTFVTNQQRVASPTTHTGGRAVICQPAGLRKDMYEALRVVHTAQFHIA